MRFDYSSKVTENLAINIPTVSHNINEFEEGL
jgi:hypothetical protein